MLLSQDLKITRVMNAQAAGTTTVNGAAVSMSGFDGVMFVLMLNTLVATQQTELKAQESSTSATTGFNDLAGSHIGPPADADSNFVMVVDIFRPVNGGTAGDWVRPVVVRGTANATIDGIIAIQYRADRKPTIQDVNTVFGVTALASPAYGTA